MRKQVGPEQSFLFCLRAEPAPALGVPRMLRIQAAGMLIAAKSIST
jgi:hypothetical protein